MEGVLWWTSSYNYQLTKNKMTMKLAEEIKQKYATPHYTFEDVTNEIRMGVFSTYETVAKYKFSEWPGFNVRSSDGVPTMKWDKDNECSSVEWLLLPKGSYDFDLRKDINKWFEDNGFVFTENEYGRQEGWRIKF